jgi:predicted nucleotidyltransferase
MDIDRDTLLTSLRELRPALERAGVTHVALVGSRARRDNRLDGDIDLLIDVDARRKFSLLDMVGMAHQVEDRLNLSTNVFMRRGLDAEFLKAVGRDQLPVF